MTRLVTLFEAAFLAGCLRLMWPAALIVADDLASASRTPAGLPDLLRMLTRYAPEVPDGESLPSHLTALAAGPGKTMAHLEARSLGAALARVDVADYRPQSGAAEAMGGRGLWAMRVPVPVRARVVDSMHFTAEIADHSLQSLLDLDLGLGDRISTNGPRHLPRHDDQLVRWLALGVQRQGLEPVRERVRAFRRRPASAPPRRRWTGGKAAPSTRRRTTSTRSECGASYRPVRTGSSSPGGASSSSGSPPTQGCSGCRTRGTEPWTSSTWSRGSGVGRASPMSRRWTWSLRSRGCVPVKSAEADRLDGLALWTDPATGAPFDVVPVVRRWVRGGGLGSHRLPLDLSLVPGLTQADLLGAASHPDVLARVRPADPGLRAVAPECGLVGILSPWLVDGRISVDAWEHNLLKGMCTDHAWTQDRALRHVAELAQHDGVLAPEVTVPPAVRWLEGGHLPLARFTESVQWVIERGGLRALWPLALGVADAAAVRTPKPNGLAVLLSSLATYAAEVPVAERSVPDGLRALAGARGSSKSHAAARSLVAALEPSS